MWKNKENRKTIDLVIARFNFSKNLKLRFMQYYTYTK